MKIFQLFFGLLIFFAGTACNSGSDTDNDLDTIKAVMPEDTSLAPLMGDTTRAMNDAGMRSGNVIMENGRMIVADSSGSTAMKGMVTLDNGTRVMPDGTYTAADGKTGKLKDGEGFRKDG